MKNLFKNAAVFVVLSIALSGFSACSNSNTQKDTAENTTSAADSVSVTNSAANSAAKNDYPPAPAGIMQAEIKDLDGNTFKLEDKKGKVLLVNMWATWCGPCRAEMPELVAMQNKYKDSGFEVIGLDTDEESPEEIKSFARTMKLNYQLGYADDKLFGEFLKVTRMQGIPQSLLINREGKLTGMFLGGGGKVVNQMKETVEKVVNQQ